MIEQDIILPDACPKSPFWGYTRKETLEQLASLEIVGDAAERIAGGLSRERHAWRTEQVLGAIAAYSGDITAEDSNNAMVVATTLTDRIGIGGSKQLTGWESQKSATSTLRLPIFSTLGKGRKYAGDGAAWTAAIEAAGNTARYQLGAGQSARVKVVPESFDIDGVETFGVPKELIPARWIGNVATEGIWNALNNGFNTNDLLLGTPQQWATMYNNPDGSKLKVIRSIDGVSLKEAWDALLLESDNLQRYGKYLQTISEEEQQQSSPDEDIPAWERDFLNSITNDNS